MGYDSNVFMQDRHPTAPGAVPARASSAVMRAGAGFDASFQNASALNFNLNYSVEQAHYEEYSSENHTAQRLEIGLRKKTGDWSYQAKASFNNVHGAEDSIIYGQQGGVPALGTSAVRSRRDQLNTKANGNITRQFETGFLRFMGDTTINDYHTLNRILAAPLAHNNNVDNSEYVVGIEAGRYLRKNLAFVTALRGGAQHQEDLLNDPTDYSNTFVRTLVGVEGSLRPDLKLTFLAGPDFRQYGHDVDTSFDRSQTRRYAELSLAWTPNTTNMITLSAKDYAWLYSSGRNSYQSTTGSLKWNHDFSPLWSSLITIDVKRGDNMHGVPVNKERLDWIYGCTLGVTRTINSHLKIDAQVMSEQAVSELKDKPGHEYTHWLVSSGIRYTF